MKSGMYWGVEVLLSCELLPLVDSASTLSVQLREAERFSPLRCEGERNSENSQRKLSELRKKRLRTAKTSQTATLFHKCVCNGRGGEKYSHIYLKHNGGQVVLTVCLNKLNKKTPTPTSTKWETMIGCYDNNETNQWYMFMGISSTNLHHPHCQMVRVNTDTKHIYTLEHLHKTSAR